MSDIEVIPTLSPEDPWKEIEQDLLKDPEPADYNVSIDHKGRKVNLNIDIDLGGGFEGGYAFTIFTSDLKTTDNFKFALHHQDFIDEIGKFFGMQDIELGYTDFDKKIIVKTNDSERLKRVLSDPTTRQIILSFPEFNLHIGHHVAENSHVETAYLELRIDEGITGIEKLRTIFHAFLLILENIDNQAVA